MLKTAFQNELLFTSTIQKGSTGTDVRRVQEWLCLNALRYPNAALSTSLDSEFGPATKRAVQNFQSLLKMPQTGVVSPDLFNKLSTPLATSFQKQPTGAIRKAVVALAQTHLKQRSAELRTNDAQNLGPWVRSYCDGLDGSLFKWCAGFVQSILDQAASNLGRNFTDIMPRTLSCDVLALSGQKNGRLMPSETVRKNPKQIQPGDLFLLRAHTHGATQPTDWFHTGLITAVSGDTIETIEGNTDTQGGSNGTGVYARVRNIQKTTLDVFSIDGL
ncbi:peptidoglycan-binding domain-containing protein [Spirosoma radiotolerans]|uniref:Peptidoglycan-binding protein n=1 Tax=Spirosoma radiotolerans TaxID=1379870 RepID=A0A0E4A1N7_9BACT|nr:peptidoglycan-binding domain-containing protein [Spirosoma radiotolerans]AKD58672.1 peptidoglycan-binding protein [Spirosoma radiotolerans]